MVCVRNVDLNSSVIVHWDTPGDTVNIVRIVFLIVVSCIVYVMTYSWTSAGLSGQVKQWMRLFFCCFFCGHSIFSSPPQRPMTSDFEGFLYQIVSITLFSYLILEKVPVFPFSMLSAKQVNY